MWIIILTLWFVVGLVCMLSLWINEMRGKEFDEDFFTEDVVFVSFVLVILGFISPFLLYAACTKEKKYFTRLIYKIANIGVRKDKAEE